MTPTKHPLSWFIERIGKKVHVARTRGDNAEQFIMTVASDQPDFLHGYCQERGDTFRDPHPLTSSILTCSVISCDACGEIGRTEDLDKEVAAKGFEGEGWKRLMDGTVNCGCGE